MAVLPGVLAGAASARVKRAGYQPQAVEFDGSNDYATRGADLTGNADSKQVTGSLWFKGTGTSQYIYTNALGRIWVRLTSAGLLSVFARNASGTDILELDTGTSYNDDAWHHAMFSIDLIDTAKRHFYIDDASDLVVITYTNDTIDFTTSDHVLGATTIPSQLYAGCLADFWLDFGTYIDLSVEANRRKFVGANAASSVDLGADGSGPTGASPIVYFSKRGSDSNDDFVTNKGTGGGFTLTGALAACATNPPSA